MDAHSSNFAPYTRLGSRPGPESLSTASLYRTPSASAREIGVFKRMDAEEVPRCEHVILPSQSWYRVWWGITVVAAFATAYIEPLIIAFKHQQRLGPFDDVAHVMEIFLFVVFGIDLFINMNTAYVEQKTQVLKTDLKTIRKHYFRGLFWFDLIGVLPLDMIAVSFFAAPADPASLLAVKLSALKWLHLVRCYRIIQLFSYMEYHAKIVSQLAMTLIRNQTSLFYIIHWAACTFYYIARLECFAPESWVGQNYELLKDKNRFDKYIYSLYFSITTFATVGFGDFHPYTVGECVFIIIYMFFNLAVSAYILGTITVLVMKGDERTNVYRERMSNLAGYAEQHHIPQHLQDCMREHLELHLHNQEAADEKVLGVYPSAIRRRILRHLYLGHIQHCYLFKGVKQKFLDALLSGARLELFMPKVEIIAEGDHVMDLYVVLQGAVEVCGARVGFGTEDVSLLGSENMSSHTKGHARLLMPGDCFGEVSFFTLTASEHAVVSQDVCRVLLISRAVYDGISADYMLGARTVLSNLQVHCEQQLSQRNRLPASRNELSSGMGAGPIHPNLGLTSLAATVSRGNYGQQQQAVVDVKRVKALIAQHTQRVTETRTNEFLSAASRGDEEKLKKMLAQGQDVNSCDYDRRTALLLACGRGHASSVRLLLESGADPSRLDSLGSSAMFEACKAGMDGPMDELLRHGGGARIHMDPGVLSGHLCRSVYDGDIRLLRRLIRGGADCNCSDYDRRSALHVAAAEGCMATIKILVEEGNASLSLQDRFGNTALDEARRTGAQAVVDYLKPRIAPDDFEASLSKFVQQRTHEMMTACADGDLKVVRSLLDRGCSANCADYDKRTGLMLAASRGHLKLVKVLLSVGAIPTLTDNFGNTAISEAEKEGHDEVLAAMQKSKR